MAAAGPPRQLRQAAGVQAARIRYYIKAQAYAEAGANEAYSIIKTNCAARTDGSKFPARTFADGSYDATVVAVSSNYAAVTCVGTRAGQTATVKLDIYNANPSTPPTTNGGPPAAVGAYTYAIMSCGKMNWSGSGQIDVGTGKVHGNGLYKMTGSKQVKGNISSSTRIWLTGSTKITGDAAAPILTYSGGAISGTKTVGPVANVSLPPIDLTPRNQALANGQVYNGNQHFTGSSDLTPGGIMWINSNREQVRRLVGCFIATGSIDISGTHQIKVATTRRWSAVTRISTSAARQVPWPALCQGHVRQERQRRRDQQHHEQWRLRLSGWSAMPMRTYAVRRAAEQRTPGSAGDRSASAPGRCR